MFLSKYGVARHIYIPIVKRGVVDLAVGADWTPSAGDVKISKDGGAAANVTNLPTAIAMGNAAMWDFSLTATEMQAAQVVVTVADSATKAVEDQAIIIETHGNASAQFQVDLADSVRAGLTALPNAAAEAAGGLYTRGTGAGQINQEDNGFISVNLKAILRTTLTETAGQIAAGFKKLLDVASPVFTLLSVVQTGDSFARLGAPAGASHAADVAAVKVDTAAVKVQTDKLTFTVANQVDSNVLDWKSATAPAMTGDAYARLGAPAGASVSADVAAIKSDTGTILTDVNSGAGAIYSRLGAPAGASMSADIAAINAKTTNLPASPAAVGSAMALTSGERDSVADALLDRTAGVETSRTLRQSLRLMLAALAGKASGLATTTATYRDTNDSKDRIVATVDANGNRSAVTLDAS